MNRYERRQFVQTSRNAPNLAARIDIEKPIMVMAPARSRERAPSRSDMNPGANAVANHRDVRQTRDQLSARNRAATIFQIVRMILRTRLADSLEKIRADEFHPATDVNPTTLFSREGRAVVRYRRTTPAAIRRPPRVSTTLFLRGAQTDIDTSARERNAAAHLETDYWPATTVCFCRCAEASRRNETSTDIRPAWIWPRTRFASRFVAD